MAATPEEKTASRPGDEVVPVADVVMDRGFDVPGTPEQVWPWIVQLGKGRGGWYFTRTLERLVPRSRRAARSILSEWQGLSVGERIPDYGGPHEYFEVVDLVPAHHVVYRSQRRSTRLSWAITLLPARAGTRVHLRLRLGPVRRVWLAESVGEFFDAATVAGMAAGLAERLREE